MARNRGLALGGPLVLFVGDGIVPDANLVAGHVDAPLGEDQARLSQRRTRSSADGRGAVGADPVDASRRSA